MNRKEDWPQGRKNVETVFPGRTVDMAALARIPLQVVIGDQDTDVNAFSLRDPSVPAENIMTRFEMAQNLAEHWKENGLMVELDVVRNVAHSSNGFQNHVNSFFRMHAGLAV